MTAVNYRRRSSDSRYRGTPRCTGDRICRSNHSTRHFSLGHFSHGTLIIVVSATLLSFMLFEILIRYAFHSVDFNFNIAAVWQSIWNFVYGLLVDLHAMNRETRTSVQLFMANMTLEMLGFLMLNQDFFIVEFAVAIPTPRFTLLLLFSSHD